MRKLLNFFFIFFFTLLISNCNFKRFEQKKYFCQKNKLDIELIDILETRSIKKSYLTIKGKEYTANILEITNQKVVLMLNDINIKINLKNDEISATNNEKIFFLKCKKSDFII